MKKRTKKSLSAAANKAWATRRANSAARTVAKRAKRVTRIQTAPTSATPAILADQLSAKAGTP